MLAYPAGIEINENIVRVYAVVIFLIIYMNGDDHNIVDFVDYRD